MSRRPLLYQLAGVEVAAGFLILFVGTHWYDAFVPWVIAGLTVLVELLRRRSWDARGRN